MRPNYHFTTRHRKPEINFHFFFKKFSMFFHFLVWLVFMMTSNVLEYWIGHSLYLKKKRKRNLHPSEKLSKIVFITGFQQKIFRQNTKSFYLFIRFSFFFTSDFRTSFFIFSFIQRPFCRKYLIFVFNFYLIVFIYLVYFIIISELMSFFIYI